MKLCKKRGFTLYELTVSIAIFALVATAVISFIVYLNSFIKTSNKEQLKMQNQAVLQQYTDLWFSYFDNENYSFLLDNTSDYIICAQQLGGENLYKIKTNTHDEKLEIIFEFPQNSNYKTLTLSCDFANSILITKHTQSTEDTNTETFSFTVQLHVKSEIYKCDLIYS